MPDLLSYTGVLIIVATVAVAIALTGARYIVRTTFAQVARDLTDQLIALNQQTGKLLGLQEIALRQQVQTAQRQGVTRFVQGLDGVFFGSRARRDRLLSDLPAELVSAINRSDIAADDLGAIVYTTASWSSECFHVLLDNIAFSLGGSDAGIRFAQLRQELKLTRP